jgi:hypothetical protein
VENIKKKKFKKKKWKKELIKLKIIFFMKNKMKYLYNIGTKYINPKNIIPFPVT